jgi:hypothetical protein
MIIDIGSSAAQTRARRAAKHVGLRARKSRFRLGTVDNRGGFMLLNPISNGVLAGERFDLTAEQVIEHCTAREGLKP